MSQRFRSALLRSVALPLLLLLALAGLLFWQLNRALDDTRWVGHTDHVIAQAHKVQALLYEQQAGLRGYLLTESTAALAPYEAANAALPATLVELRALVNDNPRQVERLGELEEAAGEWLELAKRMLRQSRSGAGYSTALVQAGTRNMAATREVLNAFVTEERRLLQRRAAVAAGSRSATLGVTSVTLALVTIGLMLTTRQGSGSLAEAFDRNVRARLRAESARLESDLFLNSVLETLGDAVIACDAEGRLTYGNRAARELYHLDLQPLSPAEWPVRYHLFKPDGRTPLPHEEVPLFRALQGEQVQGAEMVVLAPGQPPRRVLASGCPMHDRDSRIKGAVVIVHDATERLQSEEALRVAQGQLAQSQKMEAIGQLAGGVAHDFNNLLAVIMGYTEMVLWSPNLGEPARAQLGEVSRAAERAAGLTRQLLAFSRRQLLAPKVLDVSETLTSAYGMLRRLIGEDVELVLVPASRPAYVLADPGQLEQILLNLVVNARDAMPTGGKITIEIQHVELDADYARQHAEVTAGPHVLLAISDTGTGIAPEHQSRLFEPFFTTKNPGSGTGLGLATVYGIVKQSNGHLSVYSEVGVGTTFKVYFPCATPSTQAPEPSVAKPRTPRGTETILLAEDEDLVRGVTRHTLQQYGYTVLEASSGDEALRLAQAHQGAIDLLLTDVVMPHLSGRELVEQLREARPGIRVLLMSGYTDDAVVRHGILSAETAFLQKPFSASSLLQKVRQVLDTASAGEAL